MKETEIQTLKLELMQIEAELNEISDKYKIQLELEETEIQTCMDTEKRYRYKLYGIIPERKL
jgi:hypothetical protein